MEKEIEPEICPTCEGKGWYTSAEHDCGGDVDSCAYSCPIQVQVECDCGVNIMENV